MKTTIALFIALVMLLPLSANATTLTIVGGGAVLNSGFFGGLGSQLSFGGSDFSVFQTLEPGSFVDLNRAFGIEPFVQSISLHSGMFRGIAVVQVGAERCIGSDFESCGDITFTSPGFAMPADWPIDTPFVATVPFTATGQLLVGDNEYDIVGQGTVTGT